MKRWIGLGTILIVLAAAISILGRTAVDPGNFTGEWYGAEDGRLYRFRDGIIDCPEESGSDGMAFCGAYAFGGDRILLFILDKEGESQLRELYSGGEPKGEFLCENADGTGRIVFSRSSLAPAPEQPN